MLQPHRSASTDPIAPRTSLARAVTIGVIAGVAASGAQAMGSNDGVGPPVILPDPTPDPWGSIGSAALLTPSWVIVGVREKRQLDANRTLQSYGGILFWPRLSDGRPTGTPQTVWPLAPLRAARFGEALAVDGDRLLVGEPGFRAIPITWRAQGRAQIIDLSQPSPVAIEIIERPLGLPGGSASNRTGMEFGAAVSLAGNAALIGAPGLRLTDTPTSVPSGAAFLHERVTSDSATPLWPVVQFYLDPLATQGDPPPLGTRFASSVALHSADVLVGAPSSVGGEGAGLAPSQGRVIVFDRVTAAVLATLEAPTPALGDRFGTTIVIEGDRAVITAPGDECGFGEVHIYDRDAQRGWMHTATLTPPPTADPETDAGWIGFGGSVALSGGRVLVGSGGIRSADAFGHRAALFRLDADAEGAGGEPAWMLEAIIEGDPSLPTASPVALDASGALLGEASIGFGQMRYLPIARSPDLDGDGSVGPGDLSILLGAWGVFAGSPADLNGDGAVDQADLALLIGAWS